VNLLLLYDISHDGTRTKIADACLDYGLDRVQYSAFAGRLSRNHQEELMLKIRELLGKKAGRVQLIPVSADDWTRRIEFDNGMSIEAMEATHA
jgi:CRISPR-associated protein Cas2